MSRNSNAHNITAAASGGGTLQSIAAALAAGSWGTMAIGSIPPADQFAGGDTIFTYAPWACWDPANKLVVWEGGSHNPDAGQTPADYISRVLQMNGNGTWAVTVAPQNHTENHGFHHLAVSTATGRQFIKRYGTNQLIDTRLASGTFVAGTPISVPQTNVTYGLDWHPNLNNGAGGLIFMGEVGPPNNCCILKSDANGANWTTLAAGVTSGAYDQISAYNPVDDCLYIGAGNGSSAMYRVSAAGVVSAAPAYPYGGGSGLGSGHIYTGMPGMGMISVDVNRQVRMYDTVAQAWGPVLTTFPVNPFNNVYFVCPIPEYGVYALFPLANTTSLSTTCYLWKPARTFSTTFPATENPIQQLVGGVPVWLNGALNGGSWTNVQTANGRVAATSRELNPPPYNDSIACINPAFRQFTPNQGVRGTIFRTPSYTQGHESLLLLRFSITNGVARGYEIYWSTNPGMALVRWNGPLNGFLPIASAPTALAQTGDVVTAQIVNGVIQATINGTLVNWQGFGTSVNDNNNIASGNPGVGNNPFAAASTLFDYGYDDFTAFEL